MSKTTLAVVDVETDRMSDGRVPTTAFWGLAVDGDEYRRFDTTSQLWKFLRQTPGLMLYNHHDYDTVQALVDGAPLSIRDVRGGRLLRCVGPVVGEKITEWRNSHALFPSPLAEILHACGYAKHSLDSLEDRNRADTVDALDAFKRCSASYERTWGVYPLGSRYLTAASVAFAVAESHAGPLPTYLDHRDAYRGGRVEAFRIGPCGLADLYDINSSYPASFLDAPQTDTLYYARVEVDTEGPGPFCQLTASREKLMFPTGRFTTAFWGSNYDRYIRPHGQIKRLEIDEAIPCELRWLSDVSGAIRRAYAERQAAKARGDAPAAYAAKIGMNAMYGRLGMKEEREAAFYSSKVVEGSNVTYYQLAENKFLSFKRVHAEPKANYMFASFITCNARARLYDAMKRIGEVFYCDTDSMYVPHGTRKVENAGSELGQWKFEGTEDLTVTGAKDYVFGGEEKLKGGHGGYLWTPRRALAGQAVVYRERTRQTAYDKRDVLPSGATLPVERNEW